MPDLLILKKTLRVGLVELHPMEHLDRLEEFHVHRKVVLLEVVLVVLEKLHAVPHPHRHDVRLQHALCLDRHVLEVVG